MQRWGFPTPYCPVIPPTFPILLVSCLWLSEKQSSSHGFGADFPNVVFHAHRGERCVNETSSFI